MVGAGDGGEVVRRRQGRITGWEQSEGPVAAALVVASAVAGALTGAHPTGTPWVDPIYTALFAGSVTAAASVAGRATLLWLAALVTGFSRGYVIFPALASLLLAFGATVARRPSRVLNMTAAAVGAQVALRLPHTWFQGGSALVAGLAVAPCLVHAVTRMPHGPRRAVAWSASALVALAVIVSIPVAVEAALSHNRAALGTTEAEDALRAVSDGDSTGGKAQLQAAESDFASVASRVGSWWTAGARLVPVVSQQRKAALTGAQVARDVSATAGDEAGKIDFARLHFRGSGVDLTQVEELSAPLQRVDKVLTTGLTRLHSSASGWLVQPLASRLDLVTRKVANAQRSASIADQAVLDAPSLLGGVNPRHYMVAVMDPSESRGLGGLVVSYGLVTVSKGHLSLEQFQDISKLNALALDKGGVKLTGPADFLARYGQNPAVYAQNATYSPDLPTVADVLGQVYNRAYNGGLDGLLVIDPRSIGSLLSITGGVQVTGLGQLTSSNAEEVLEKGQYAAYPSPTQQTVRRNALDSALKEVLSRLTAMPLPGPRTMSETLDPDVQSGDLLFWSLHRSDQSFLEQIGMAGSFPAARGDDLLGVVTSNAGANKIDAYLQRTITDRVDYDRSSGKVTATVQVVLHNEAPAQGLSSEVIGSYSGSGLAPGTNRLWLNVYSPLALSGAVLGGKPLATDSVGELGVSTYSAFVSIPPGGTATVTFQLHGSVASGQYRLHFYSQPTVLPDRATVTVSGGSGTMTWSPTGHSRNFHVFSS